MKQTQFVPGHYYHVFNRGINHGTVFFSRDNFGFFIKKLREYFSPDTADIVAYCLMPTHYHILACIKREDFGVRVMQPLGTSYTKALNVQLDRAGPLFQGTFKAKHIGNDIYLRQVSRYIHLNPQSAGLVESAEHWPFSSYREYIGTREGSLPKTEAILTHFASRADYKAFVESRSDCTDASLLAWFASIA